MGPANPTSVGKKVSIAAPVLVAFGGGKIALVVAPANEEALNAMGLSALRFQRPAAA